MKLGTTKQESLMEPGSQPPVSSETMVESLRASHFVHTCLGYVLRWPQSVTSILILGRKEGKALKTLDDFICFTFGYPSLFIAHIHKIIPINVCMLNTSHCGSVYTPDDSFICSTSVERTRSSLVQSPPPPPPPRCQQYERITGQVRFSSNYT